MLYLFLDEVVKRYRLRLHQKSGPLVAEICKTEKITNRQEYEKLYQKILTVITILSGLGNPTVVAVIQEVSVALKSIFQPLELEYYVKMSKREKEEQLMELMCIVAGIRLFNRDCQRGGEGIDDLPAILQKAVKRSCEIIMGFLEDLMLKIYKFTAIIEKICFPKELPINIFTKSNIEWASDMLTVCRQQEIYIRKLLSDIDRSDKEIQNYLKRLQERFFKLHDTVRYKTAIPSTEVYPQFIDLADIWMGLQDEVIIISNINNFFWEFQALIIKNNMNIFNEILMMDMLSDSKILTDAERLELSMGELIDECGPCTVYYPNDTVDFENINLEFLGFCAWMFIRNGVLIPGNPNNGVVKWKGKYYVFCSTNAAKEFGRDPDRYVYEGLDFIRNRLEHVYLFQVYDDVRALETEEMISEQGPELKICNHQMVQTDLHILPSFIDKNYSSNIWELRNKALHLATISRYKTRSTQTHMSNFRYGVYVQAAPPRDKEVQTRRDNYTNTKKLLTYIFGLRGRNDDNQHVVSFLESELKHL
ncbi:cilia- and flagella-associated protein 206 isoform X2 [Apis florea]|uniref:cilia- and flagella-associated protein 206 isoform X2 n=1 Tax=Apis florea TaxID=7463 RepID=UPI0012FEB2A3|nr:cilia- and flagella-associated protein 206 isoform X2 [Apis florea]